MSCPSTSTVPALGKVEDHRFEVVYHLRRMADGALVRLKVRVREDDCVVPSATGVFKGLDWFERIVIVEWCVNGTARLTRGVGDILRKLQTGAVQFYALVFTIGVTALLYTLILVRHP